MSERRVLRTAVIAPQSPRADPPTSISTDENAKHRYIHTHMCVGDKNMSCMRTVRGPARQSGETLIVLQ